MGIIKNMVSDYGFDKTGATNNLTKFYTLAKPDMAGQDTVVHNYDPGSYKQQGFFSAVGVIGSADITVNATGATFNDGGSGASGGDGTNGLPYSSAHLAQIGIDATVITPVGFTGAGGKTARILTCYPGAKSVTLTAASASAGHISRFSIGQWIMVCGWSLQGEFQSAYSFPPNFHYWDFVKITGIVGNTITFANDVLTFYYDQNWPEINRGSEFECDAAGPATIFAMSPDWDGKTTINGGTLDITPVNSTYVNAYRRETYFNNIPQLGKTFYPSVQKLFKAVNSGASVSVEHDKLIDLVDVSNATYGQWHVQSSSTKMFKVDNCTVQRFNGTGRACDVSNTTVNEYIALGPTSYGVGTTSKFTNCTVAGSINGGKTVQSYKNVNTGFQGAITMSSGVMTVPMNMGIDFLAFCPPNPQGKTVLFWVGDNGASGSFQVLSATSDRWPAADDTSTTIGVSFTTGTKTLTTDTPLFTPGDVGKVLYLPGMKNNFSFGNCTITNASPGVVTFSSHNKVANEPVKFQAAGGTLPSQIVAGTEYYVLNPTTNTFQVSATPGGAAINTSGGSGTVQANYVGSTFTNIVSYVNSTTITVFDALDAGNFSSVSRTLRYGTCNAYVQTNQSGGLPALSSISPSSGLLRFYTPPAYSVTFSNCTGTAQVLDLSQSAAQGKPLFSYTKRSFNGQTGFTANSNREYREPGITPAMSIGCMGRVTSLKVNVITPYTGAGTLTMQPVLRGHVGDLQTGSSQFYAPTINLKMPGERVFTPGNAATGAQTGDTLTMLPAQIFNHGSYYPSLSRSIAAEGPGDWSGPIPEFTVEIITDQGFPTEPVAVAPLRLRLRAA